MKDIVQERGTMAEQNIDGIRKIIYAIRTVHVEVPCLSMAKI